MKKLLIYSFLLLSATLSQAQDIKWVTLEEALELQEKNPKKIIMDVYTNWCGPCKMLDQRTFKNKDVANYINDNYYAVKFNGEGDKTVNYKENTFTNPQYDPAKANRRNSAHQFARYMKVNAYPTLVFFDEKGDFITPIKGFQTPQQLELYLKLFKTDKYKEMTNQAKFNAFHQAFKPEFKS
jgi:thioredoxin-related protein